MNLRTRPARVAAAVGAVLAAGTTTFVALTAGTAAADEPGRCTQNVNVREDPDSDARIVALCEAGKEVELGEERDGFVRIDELDGWAAKDFVKAETSGSSSSSSSSTSSSSSSSSSSERSSSSSERDGDSEGDSDSDRATRTESGGTHSADAETAGDDADADPVGGLLG